MDGHGEESTRWKVLQELLCAVWVCATGPKELSEGAVVLGWFVLSPLVVVATKYRSASPHCHRLVQHLQHVFQHRERSHFLQICTTPG